MTINKTSPKRLVMGLSVLGLVAGFGPASVGEARPHPDSPARVAAAEEELREIRIAVPVSRSSAVVETLVGVEAGIFEEFGFDVELVTMEGPQIGAALVSGDVDATPALNILAALNGADVRVVAVSKSSYDYAILARGFTDAAELAGKTIVTAPPSSPPGVALTVALEDLGLVPGEDVEVVHTRETRSRVSLLVTGQVDASVVNTDAMLRLQVEHPDLHVVYRPEQFPTIPFGGVTVTTTTLEEDPAFVEQLISAYLAVVRFIADNPAESIELFADVYELPLEQAATMYDLISPLLVLDGLMTDELWAGEARIDSVTLGREVTVEEVESAFDLSIVEAITARSGDTAGPSDTTTERTEG